MSKSILIAACLATGTGGIAVGLAMRPAPVETARTTASREPPAEISTSLDRAQLASMIRSIVRDEVGRATPPAPQPATTDEARAPAPPEPTAEQVEAHDRGQSVIASAQRAGHWSEDDRRQFREVLRQVNGAERDELLHTLLPAINRQELKVDTFGPPF
jgi:hypothetical protein